MPTKEWIGSVPGECDICSTDIQDIGQFVDGKTRFGCWGIMCPMCHRDQGFGLGTGKGQLFEFNGKSWILIAGSEKENKT